MRFFVTILCLSIVLSGCVQSQKKKESEKLPSSQDIQKEEKVMISTGTRVIPGSCKAGDTVIIKINVSPANQISGVIVTEKIPDGWELIKSDPQFSRVESGNVYKWLQWAQQVAPFVIVYQVRIPETAKGKFTFEGKLTTFREGDISITGDSEITVK